MAWRRIGNLRGPAGLAGSIGPPGEAIKGEPGERGPIGIGEVGPVGPPGRDGQDAEPELVAHALHGFVIEEIERRVAALKLPIGAAGPPGRDGERGADGSAGRDADPEIVARMVGDQIEQPLHAYIDQQIQKLPVPKDGRDGKDGASGPAGESIVGPMGPPGSVGPKGDQGLKGDSGMRGAKGDPGEIGPQGPEGLKGDSGERGPAGPPGKLPLAKTWKPETVFYAGDVVTCEGSLFQASRDTGQPTHHDDWVCLARAGRDGLSPNVRGTFHTDETYARLDIVVYDGCPWIARHDNPGSCPGKGWQLMNTKGRTGAAGEIGPRGERGEKGQKGDPGADAPMIVDWQVDHAGYHATPVLSNGKTGPVLNLRGLFERFQEETAG